VRKTRVYRRIDRFIVDLRGFNLCCKLGVEISTDFGFSKNQDIRVLCLHVVFKALEMFERLSCWDYSGSGRPFSDWLQDHKRSRLPNGAYQVVWQETQYGRAILCWLVARLNSPLNLEGRPWVSWPGVGLVQLHRESYETCALMRWRVWVASGDSEKELGRLAAQVVGWSKSVVKTAFMAFT
jgi:hypothetical protein